MKMANMRESEHIHSRGVNGGEVMETDAQNRLYARELSDFHFQSYKLGRTSGGPQQAKLQALRYKLP